MVHAIGYGVVDGLPEIDRRAAHPQHVRGGLDRLVNAVLY
jgi:hypothetical protein